MHAKWRGVFACLSCEKREQVLGIKLSLIGVSFDMKLGNLNKKKGINIKLTIVLPNKISWTIFLLNGMFFFLLDHFFFF